MSTPSLSARPALLFDLDGTLVDSVYQHVLAWREALEAEGIDLAVWRIHRRIGMSGGLFLKALDREVGRSLTEADGARLRDAHAKAYLSMWGQIRPLPGAVELLQTLTALRVPWAVATSGSEVTAKGPLSLLGIPAGTPIVTRDQVAYAKPNPDLFLVAAERLGVPPGDCFVVGDSIWDLLAAQRAGALGVGLLSGGYGSEELETAGAYRVYDDPGDLLAHLDELGVRSGASG
jgi:HAD superfamily hydrolase (TIGR01509 family)